MRRVFLKDLNFNGWIIYWFVLMIFNFFAFTLSAENDDFFSCALSGFMLLFCGIAFSDNINKNKDEDR
tara:strand:- start:1359 stop:1562 length:204 start_codon:yes stop_codon:yes gene_type:complete